MPGTTETLVEIESGRAVLSSSSRTTWRAPRASVALLAPADAFPLLAPALRRPYAAGFRSCSAPPGRWTSALRSWRWSRRTPERWPGMPIISVVDDRSAILARAAGRRRARPLEHRARVRGRRAARARATSARAMSDDLHDEAYWSSSASIWRSFPTGSTSFARTSRPSAPFAARTWSPRSRPDSIGSPDRAARTAFPRSA